MPVTLQSGHLEALRRHAEAEYPAECCGILLGDATGGVKRVAEVVPLANLRHEPARAQALLPVEDPGRETERNRFLIDPLEQLRVEKDARGRGLTVVGYYHSHPDHPARPSAYDREHAWPWYSYVIVSVEAGQAGDALSWTLAGDRSSFEPETLELAEAGGGQAPAAGGGAAGPGRVIAWPGARSLNSVEPAGASGREGRGREPRSKEWLSRS